ncbi:MAG: hypothetical protein IT445_20785 [Phycisphaeraceae bacterium]|nr:hypothetical protein [Phycisphaeraceae bacterium]
MNRLLGMVILMMMCASCNKVDTTELARVPSPDGHAIAIVTQKVKTGIPLPGPEPPPVKRQWIRLTVLVDGKQTYNSGFEDVGEFQPCYFACDLAWSADSSYLAYRAITTLHIIGIDGTQRSINVITDNSLVSSFKWVSDKELLVVSKMVDDPLDLYGYPQHYHAYLTSAKNVRILRLDVDGGITERFICDVKDPTFTFRSTGFMNQEISPFSSRVAFSDGNAVCVYDDSVGRLIAQAPVNGSIEGTWWDTDDKLIVGIGLLSGDMQFATFDVLSEQVQEHTSLYLPLWTGMWDNVDWYRQP